MPPALSRVEDGRGGRHEHAQHLDAEFDHRGRSPSRRPIGLERAVDECVLACGLVDVDAFVVGRTGARAPRRSTSDSNEQDVGGSGARARVRFVDIDAFVVGRAEARASRRSTSDSNEQDVA